ncbi:hypothetical protein [Bauldia litoralis]|uniref:Uncharacterized protein n=1 Tax=Bauldia litoralis TaxID=665467 RepID=A0A1G6EGE5_9HYPH|nr:hypothetical protein [Bauldia litoralis]SDB56539.1 hypothetical protein SAMN02982931_04493 [Bauldia litoralis]
MNLFRKLIIGRPRGFDRAVTPTFGETLVWYGSITTADRLFTGERIPTGQLAFHVFFFDFDDIRYEFKVIDEEQVLDYAQDRAYRAWFDTKTRKRCWFDGEERKVLVSDPEDDDDDED